MQLFKSSLFLIIFIFCGYCLAMQPFSDNECIDSSFTSKITHDSFPFGLSKQVLTIKKENCVLDIELERFKVLKNSWEVDVCREPIHIKEDGASGPEVLKKTATCDKQKPNDFCNTWKKIQGIVQDDGLIFAKGEKEDLRSDHGKVYCTYLLLKKYLDDEKILSRHQIYTNLLIHQESGASLKTISTTAPQSTDVAPVAPTP